MSGTAFLCEWGEDEHSLGKCCGCGCEGAANIVCLPLRSPAPGEGCWGCLVCGLPQAGATAVLCDACLSSNREPACACLGAPGENRRVAVDLLTQPFEHNRLLHLQAEMSAALRAEREIEMRKLRASWPLIRKEREP
jgi:hypothetical protein